MSIDPSALLAWFRAHRRSMPWREQVSPYRTLVSELMLQQTRVETVIPYFERFMAAFPTVEALATAPESRVLELWAGLGYYRRARNLQRAAQAVAAAGGFPTTVEGLLTLPGVGPYTAGAIGSIAMGLDAPLVDGNVERVLARVYAMEDAGPALTKRAWVAAGEGVRVAVATEPGSAGAYNEALMELGATVCVPVAPACGACPIARGCAGKERTAELPRKVAKKTSPTVHAVALLVEVDGRLWLGKRPPGLLGGLWEPPITANFVGGERVADVLHVFTHRRLVVEVRRVGEVEDMPMPVLTTGAYVEEAWVPRGELEFRAMSKLAWKIVGAG